MKAKNKSIETIEIRKLEVGVRFRVFRELNALLGQDLAEELGVAPEVIEDLEEGRAFPEIEVLHHMYVHYGLNVNWLVGRAGEMINDKDPRGLKKILNHKPSSRSETERQDALMELMELMELPAIEGGILAALAGVKAELANRALAAKEEQAG